MPLLTESIAEGAAISQFGRAREPAGMDKRMPMLDWTQREIVFSDLRPGVHRLLEMYGYPAVLSVEATQFVLKQEKLSTEYAECRGYRRSA